jgi:SAM-dependent methyltransferase
MSELRLNLASGTDIRRGNGWINLDVVPQWPPSPSGITYPPCDVIWDAKDPIPFPDGSVDEIYAGYLFLHVRPFLHQALIAEIRRVLKPNARLVVGEVDMALVMPRWLADPSDRGVSELVWGEMGSTHGRELSQWDEHRWGWTESKLRSFLEDAGFVGIRRIRIHCEGVWYELTLEARKP